MSSKETSYYNSIKQYLIQQLKSNFSALGKDYTVSGESGNIKTGLNNLLDEGFYSEQLKNFALGVPPLLLDIFIVIMNSTGDYVLIVCEVKDVKSLGLTHLSQLIGYCLISDARYGLLINIDNYPSKPFKDILDIEKYITNIKTISGDNGDRKINSHKLGIMIWNSVTNRLDYTGNGEIRSIPEICSLIIDLLG